MIWIFLLTQAVNKAMEYIIAKKKRTAIGMLEASSLSSPVLGKIIVGLFHL
jgi:hypothetical protein